MGLISWLCDAAFISVGLAGLRHYGVFNARQMVNQYIRHQGARSIADTYLQFGEWGLSSARMLMRFLPAPPSATKNASNFKDKL